MASLLRFFSRPAPCNLVYSKACEVYFNSPQPTAITAYQGNPSKCPNDSLSFRPGNTPSAYYIKTQVMAGGKFRTLSAPPWRESCENVMTHEGDPENAKAYVTTCWECGAEGVGGVYIHHDYCVKTQ